ncbi:hypothetical protein [Desulfotomaculum copahuensis]|uniref:Uncharacterized protein n=1 Tax=Desulfotomaculum copahuensis TaxID=1838280 RepID=A0A1B7LDT0_9FIRM|nr:hypothetical protein [Desulfotomaculum copahuensis]OAT81252.1 hypothetical protein A6M21_00175 [Desulfotomaculum copahuensis]
MNEYKLVVVVETKEHVYIRMFVNNVLANPEGLIRLKPDELDQLFRDLFKGSRGKCIKCYCVHSS